MSEDWEIRIIKKGDKINFIYDSNIDRYTIIGLLETEITLLKQEMIQQTKKE